MADTLAKPLEVPSAVPNALTELACRAAQPPAKGQTTLWDASLKGFGLRLSQGGSKTFVVLIASGRRQAIGRYPQITLSEARTQAKRLLAEKHLGRIKPIRTAWDDAKADYLADCAKRIRPLTLRDYTRHLAVHFSFERKALADITPKDILKRINAIGGYSEKHHAFTAARAFFKWCTRQHIIDRSPMENMQTPSNGTSRERVLSDDELRTLLTALSPPRTTFHRIVLLCIHLGIRRSEAASMRWQWLTEGMLTIPGEFTKNGEPLILPLTPKVKDIIEQVPKLSDTYLFPAARERSEKTTVFNGWGKPKAQLDKECPIAPWTLHDLRRTFATGMQRLGVRMEVTEALLNHISGSRAGVAGIYQRHHFFPEKLEALKLWEEYLVNLR